jgi:hypothetical protein
MSDHELNGLNDDPESIALNTEDTVAITEYKRYSDNQTRVGYFTPEYLLEWAEAIHEAYGDTPCVEVVFTPDKPMTATEGGSETDDEKLGIAVAPRIFPEKDNE